MLFVRPLGYWIPLCDDHLGSYRGAWMAKEMCPNPVHEIKSTHTRKLSNDFSSTNWSEHYSSIDLLLFTTLTSSIQLYRFQVKMAAGNTAGNIPATPIKRIPAYMLPKKPTYRQAQLLLKSTKSSRLQASRSAVSQFEVSADESYSANGDEEEQPSFDQAMSIRMSSL